MLKEKNYRLWFITFLMPISSVIGGGQSTTILKKSGNGYINDHKCFSFDGKDSDIHYWFNCSPKTSSHFRFESQWGSYLRDPSELYPHRSLGFAKSKCGAYFRGPSAPTIGYLGTILFTSDNLPGGNYSFVKNSTYTIGFYSSHPDNIVMNNDSGPRLALFDNENNSWYVSDTIKIDQDKGYNSVVTVTGNISDIEKWFMFDVSTFTNDELFIPDTGTFKSNSEFQSITRVGIYIHAELTSNTTVEGFNWGVTDFSIN